MKPSTRIEELYPGEIGLNNRMTEDEIEKAMLWRKITAIMDYLDEQAELLDTHTVKEEKEVLLGEDKSDRVHVKLFGYRKDGVVYVTREEVKEEVEMVRCEHGLIAGDECDCGKGYHKEEPTTPEKDYDCKNDTLDYCHVHEDKCNEPPKKLPTSSYEVTCGRCEKSVKHYCGRV
jgi:hypothetical protein